MWEMKKKNYILRIVKSIYADRIFEKIHADLVEKFYDVILIVFFSVNRFYDMFIYNSIYKH